MPCADVAIKIGRSNLQRNDFFRKEMENGKWKMENRLPGTIARERKRRRDSIAAPILHSPFSIFAVQTL